MRDSIEEAEHAVDAALDRCRRSREVELTLEAQRLDLSIARRIGSEERASELRGSLLDAAIDGGYHAIRAEIEQSSSVNRPGVACARESRGV